MKLSQPHARAALAAPEAGRTPGPISKKTWKLRAHRGPGTGRCADRRAVAAGLPPATGHARRLAGQARAPRRSPRRVRACGITHAERAEARVVAGAGPRLCWRRES